MPASLPVPAALIELAHRIHAECEALSAAWLTTKAEALQADLERLADFAANLDHEPLQAAALDLYAFFGHLLETEPSASQLERLQGLVEALRLVIPGVREQSAPAPRGSLLAVFPERQVPDRARARLQSQGFELLVTADADRVADYVDHALPAAILTDTALVRSLTELLDQLAETRPALARVPLLAVGNGDCGGSSRLQALIDGADAWVDGLDGTGLVKDIAAVIDSASADPYRVLVVDDDRQLAMYCEHVLRRAGMMVRIEHLATAVLPAVREFRPDLILLDLYLEGQDGMSLTGELRRHSESLVLPIVFLSGERNELARFHAIEAGGDDFLTKPIRPRHLVAAVRSRIKRVRLLGRQVVRADPQTKSTALVRKGEFLSALSTAQAADRNRVLVAVRIDQSEELSRRLGMAARYELEQALAQRLLAVLDPGDLLCLWREFELGVLLAPGQRRRAIALADALREAIARQPFKVQGQDVVLTASLGLALQPRPPADRDAWIGVAFAAQGAAQRLGGNRVDGVLGEDDSGLPPERLIWVRELVRRAARGSGFVVEFQPFLPLRGGGHGQYKLLLSLRDQCKPLNGVSRHEYLKVARELGALAGLERIAIFRALEAMDEQRSRDRAATLIVPIDACSLEPSQIEWLEREWLRRGFVGQQLAIEIDVTHLRDKPESLAAIHRLRELGVRVHGADRSGRLGQLSELVRLPLDGLCVPLETVQSADAPTVARLLDQWHGLDRTITVDGVDEVKVLHSLWNLGVDYLSGEAVAAPSPRLDYDFDAIEANSDASLPD